MFSTKGIKKHNHNDSRINTEQKRKSSLITVRTTRQMLVKSRRKGDICLRLMGEEHTVSAIVQSPSKGPQNLGPGPPHNQPSYNQVSMQGSASSPEGKFPSHTNRAVFFRAAERQHSLNRHAGSEAGLVSREKQMIDYSPHPCMI